MAFTKYPKKSLMSKLDIYVYYFLMTFEHSMAKSYLKSNTLVILTTFSFSVVFRIKPNTFSHHQNKKSKIKSLTDCFPKSRSYLRYFVPIHTLHECMGHHGMFNYKNKVKHRFWKELFCIILCFSKWEYTRCWQRIFPNVVLFRKKNWKIYPTGNQRKSKWEWNPINLSFQNHVNDPHFIIRFSGFLKLTDRLFHQVTKPAILVISFPSETWRGHHGCRILCKEVTTGGL